MNDDIAMPMDKYVKMLLRQREQMLKSLGPGKARDDEIKVRLEQGQSFFDIASHLQRAVPFIAREAECILGRLKLEATLSTNKKERSNPWSDAEVEQLRVWRQQNLPQRKIRQWLRRTNQSINKRLQELWSPVSDQQTIQGRQVLPAMLPKTLFHDRMVDIFGVRMESDMTETWRTALQKRSVHAWVSSISGRVPEEVQRLLGNIRSLTWEEIKRIPLIKTTSAGVYARLATSQYKLGLAHDRYLYVGSASSFGGGLSARMKKHITDGRSRLQRDTRRKRLKGEKGKFVTLLVMDMERTYHDSVLEVRRTVTLAEAIFTVWLGALKSPTRSLASAYPWDIRLRQYTGWASHNPLEVDVQLPIGCENLDGGK